MHKIWRSREDALSGWADRTREGAMDQCHSLAHVTYFPSPLWPIGLGFTLTRGAQWRLSAGPGTVRSMWMAAAWPFPTWTAFLNGWENVELTSVRTYTPRVPFPFSFHSSGGGLVVMVESINGVDVVYMMTQQISSQRTYAVQPSCGVRVHACRPCGFFFC